MNTIFYLEWNEIEFGWGERPDGFSFHLTPEAAEEYKKLFTQKNEYYYWFAEEVKFYRVEDKVFEKLKELIETSKEKLGIPSAKWNITDALKELTT